VALLASGVLQVVFDHARLGHCEGLRDADLLGLDRQVEPLAIDPRAQLGPLLMLSVQEILSVRAVTGACMRALIILSLLTLPVAAPQAAAHSGGLNSEGCHNNHKTGDYHCHRQGSSRPAPQPRSTPRKQDKGWTYRNCTEARAAGAAPVYRGQPGYGPHLDRDNDGVGCEPYRGR